MSLCVILYNLQSQPKHSIIRRSPSHPCKFQYLLLTDGLRVTVIPRCHTLNGQHYSRCLLPVSKHPQCVTSNKEHQVRGCVGVGGVGSDCTREEDDMGVMFRYTWECCTGAYGSMERKQVAAAHLFCAGVPEDWSEGLLMTHGQEKKGAANSCQRLHKAQAWPDDPSSSTWRWRQGGGVRTFTVIS